MTLFQKMLVWWIEAWLGGPKRSRLLLTGAQKNLIPRTTLSWVFSHSDRKGIEVQRASLSDSKTCNWSRAELSFETRISVFPKVTHLHHLLLGLGLLLCRMSSLLFLECFQIQPFTTEWSWSQITETLHGPLHGKTKVKWCSLVHRRMELFLGLVGPHSWAQVCLFKEPSLVLDLS